MRPRIEPIEEIKFAARHGFLTKALWIEFFGTGTGNWRNRRWKHFRDSGMFRGSRDHLDLLIPNSKHPLVREHAPLVSRPPRIEQLAHDTAIARGDLVLKRSIPRIRIVVEAEAKRKESFFNRGFSNLELDKFPDLAVWQDGFGVAVEIETSTKSKERYREIFERYKSASFSHVVYVVADLEMKILIDSIAEGYKNHYLIGFASLKSWLEDPAKAKVVTDSEPEKFKDLFRI